MKHPGTRLREIQARLDEGDEMLSQDVEWLIQQLREYDSIICWETTCVESARLLDKSYEDYHHIKDLENYVEHKITCPDWGHRGEGHRPMPCDCGLSDLLGINK